MRRIHLARIGALLVLLFVIVYLLGAGGSSPLLAGVTTATRAFVPNCELFWKTRYIAKQTIEGRLGYEIVMGDTAITVNGVTLYAVPPGPVQIDIVLYPNRPTDNIVEEAIRQLWNASRFDRSKQVIELGRKTYGVGESFDFDVDGRDATVTFTLTGGKWLKVEYLGSTVIHVAERPALLDEHKTKNRWLLNVFNNYVGTIRPGSVHVLGGGYERHFPLEEFDAIKASFDFLRAKRTELFWHQESLEDGTIVVPVQSYRWPQQILDETLPDSLRVKRRPMTKPHRLSVDDEGARKEVVEFQAHRYTSERIGTPAALYYPAGPENKARLVRTASKDWFKIVLMQQLVFPLYAQGRPTGGVLVSTCPDIIDAPLPKFSPPSLFGTKEVQALESARERYPAQEGYTVAYLKLNFGLFVAVSKEGEETLWFPADERAYTFAGIPLPAEGLPTPVAGKKIRDAIDAFLDKMNYQPPEKRFTGAIDSTGAQR